MTQVNLLFRCVHCLKYSVL